MAKMGKIRIGISGWRYKGWRGVFYPPKLPQREELRFAAGKFPSLEINGTFYSLQRPSSFERWAAETPADFVFAVKGPRYITHMLKLKEAKAPLANFFASGVLLLGAKLGPILWQLPPNFGYNAEKLRRFFELLPRDAGLARRLARRHEKWLKKRVAFEDVDPKYKMRHALEIRHESFMVPEFVELLRKHDVAMVCADTVAWPRITEVTSDFVYCRPHGSKELYSSGYDPEALDQWAEWVLTWASGGQPAEGAIDGKPKAERKGRDVYVYFDNDAKVRAPFDAQELIKRVIDRENQLKVNG